MLSQMHANPVVYCEDTSHNFVTYPDPKITFGIPLHIVGALKMVIKYAGLVTSFFNQMLKSDVCMLSSEDIVLELKAKKIWNE